MSALLLEIVTPEGEDRKFECDSISLWLAADTRERGEGSMGIRKGHIESVIALGNGPLTARQDGKTVFSAQTEGGFATVLHDRVTVVTPHLQQES